MENYMLVRIATTLIDDEGREYPCGASIYNLDEIGKIHMLEQTCCWSDYEPKKKKKEDEMSHNNINVNTEAPLTEANTLERQRAHLDNRRYGIFAKKQQKAQITYGLRQDPDLLPKSPQELIDAIKAGHVTVRECWTEDYKGSYHPATLVRDYLRFGPKLKEDYDGYNAYEKKITEENVKMNDSVQINTPAQALADLQAWEQS